jgi:hypothetical protein
MAGRLVLAARRGDEGERGERGEEKALNYGSAHPREDRPVPGCQEADGAVDPPGEVMNAAE